MKRWKIPAAVLLTASVLLGGCGAASSEAESAASVSAESAAAAVSEETAESTAEETAEETAESAAEETAESTAEEEPESTGSVLEDGVYSAEFHTDNSMFRVNETCDGRGTLTVENGEMTIHVTLLSKRIVNLFYGTAEDAQKEGAALIEPTIDNVTYDDGYEQEVYGFDIPVPAIDEEFDVALVGKKGKWYDHKVYVSDPVPAEG